MFSGIMYDLKVKILDTAKDAMREGFIYREPVFKPIRIDQVVVIKDGTNSGKSTVDLILVDEKGQKYACMLSGDLLKSIPTEFE